MTDRPSKIFPRNLTARAAYAVPGNPVTTRPEDAVGNCYPGLELDVRNFDRRFFPGLVFNFVARNDNAAPYSYPEIYGGKLAYVDAVEDPDLRANTPEVRQLWAELTSKGSQLADGRWYIDWIDQGGRRLRMYRIDDQNKEQPLDGLVVWRLVRSLEPQPLTINLKERDSGRQVQLRGWRRRYTDPVTGVISKAYKPGELTQGLCSPWQHDFRDCACNYWSSNHPDVVFGEVYPGETTFPGGEPEDPGRAQTRLDWLRRDRSREMAASASNTIPKNRPFQLDHFEINHTWQSLSMVIADREMGGIYVPDEADDARPFASARELATHLRRLAPLEMALAIEYIYARFSLRTAQEARDLVAKDGRWPTMPDDVTFARHYLMLTAVSEMQHLRWVNHLLWELHNARLIDEFQPLLDPADMIPTENGMRPRALRSLPDGLADFIAVEHPSGFIDGAYSRVVATLRDTTTYPPTLLGIAERIVSDGIDHESRFLDIKAVLKTYEGAGNPAPYLRPMTLGDPADPKVDEALIAYDNIRANLRNAYADGAQGHVAHSGELVTGARVAMNRLLAIGEELGARGIGIPFWRGS